MIKKYLEDLIQGVSYLHDNELVHGNLNLFQICLCFDECKIKPSLCCESESTHFKTDIINIAILAYEMAYGINPQLKRKDTQYEKEQTYGEK